VEPLAGVQNTSDSGDRWHLFVILHGSLRWYWPRTAGHGIPTAILPSNCHPASALQVRLALAQKVSRERVGAELEGMLHGTDRGNKQGRGARWQMQFS
jgi:hypothetical protein